MGQRGCNVESISKSSFNRGGYSIESLSKSSFNRGWVRACSCEIEPVLEMGSFFILFIEWKKSCKYLFI
jgi:hypothetical protein